MCEAVAVCHDVGVFHRDIKPENFIVTDGWVTSMRSDLEEENGDSPLDEDFLRERKVIVKLTDFGLSTRDSESGDMDCGSAPYMSFECRNNCAPTYAPRVADVWSLGIVLVNMCDLSFLTTVQDILTDVVFAGFTTSTHGLTLLKEFVPLSSPTANSPKHSSFNALQA